jgi:hypothetical protein
VNNPQVDETRILNHISLNQLKNKSRNPSVNATAQIDKSAVLVPIDEDYEMEKRRHHRRNDRESMDFLLNEEYVLTPLTQQRMNEFYGATNPEASKTFDGTLGVKQKKQDQPVYETFWGQPQMSRTAATAMYYNDDEAIATNLEYFKKNENKVRDITNDIDDMWGRPVTPLTQHRVDSQASIKESYI